MSSPRLGIPAALPAAASLRGSTAFPDFRTTRERKTHPSSATASRGRPVAKSKLQLLSLSFQSWAFLVWWAWDDGWPSEPLELLRAFPLGFNCFRSFPLAKQAKEGERFQQRSLRETLPSTSSGNAPARKSSNRSCSCFIASFGGSRRRRSRCRSRGGGRSRSRSRSRRSRSRSSSSSSSSKLHHHHHRNHDHHHHLYRLVEVQRCRFGRSRTKHDINSLTVFSLDASCEGKPSHFRF